MNIFKYQALGNDMLVIDPAKLAEPLPPAAIRQLCDRHFGVGADGVCYGPLPGHNHPRAMRFFNPDGSEAEKSGNGLRIFARYLWDYGYVSGPHYDIWINNESVGVEVKDEMAGTIALQMGRLSFASADIPASGPAREIIDEAALFGGREWRITAANIGNPHCVIFSEGDLAELARTVGPVIETAALFPHRTNVQFARAIDRHTLEIEIWERGAGYTLASGTSASAAAGAAIKTNRCDSPVEVRMAGGAARVDIDAGGRVTLTGPVAAVFSGRLAADFWAG